MTAEYLKTKDFFLTDESQKGRSLYYLTFPWGYKSEVFKSNDCTEGMGRSVFTKQYILL